MASNPVRFAILLDQCLAFISGIKSTRIGYRRPEHYMPVTPAVELPIATGVVVTPEGQPLAIHATVSRLNLSWSVIVPLVIFTLVGAVLLAVERHDYPDLHTILDTSSFLLAGVLASLLWDMGTRVRSAFLLGIALSFAVTSLLECVHTVVTVEWSGFLAPLASAQDVLRPASWPPPAYLLPIGVGYSVWRLGSDRQDALGLAVVLILLSASFFALFFWLPRYTAPTWLGVTRPTLFLVPVLWAIIGWACWRQRGADRLLPMLALMAAVLFVAHVMMLYSRAPHDAQAMIAHLGKVAGSMIVLLSLMRMASSDIVERIRAERALAQLNEALERRVADRTRQLESANQSLQAEIGVRQQAELKTQAQLMRLNLLHEITHAIGERQDLPSIFQVVIRSLEDHLPIDFGCICRHEPVENVLIVTSVGARGNALARELLMTEGARVPVDQNGLSRCLRGQLVYEPDLAAVSFPFPRRLAGGGLRALVAASLLAENKVFGVLIAARYQVESFSSPDCEFLRQLSEHVGLAANQSQLYGSLQQAYDELRQTQHTNMQQERLRSLGQMASGVAHDINNAISPVALYTASLLEQEPGLSTRARNYLVTIQRAIHGVAETVSRMREFSRPRELQLTPALIDLNRIVEQVLDLTRVRWSDLPQERGSVISIKTQMAAGLPAVMGAESEIRDALTNLIFNAVDAMPDGGTLTVRTRVLAAPGEDESGTVCLEVCDTGVGMDDATRQLCIEPFFTTKGERGTGLGLAMVYGTVQRHGAEMEIDSARGKGTTMRLIFPLAAVALTPSVSQQTTRPLQPLRILIVDDDPLVIEALRDTLQFDGHQVTAADGGQAGIDAFTAAQSHNLGFDAVITDLGMPYIDGRRVATAVKIASPATPVILLTGWGQRMKADQETPANVDGVLNKPPKLRELRSMLAALATDR
jgi:signal transduction histidine kinase/CheY-like chemotaxis protein